MYDPASFEDEPPRMIRSTREMDREETWRERMQRIAADKPFRIATHYCASCNGEMEIDHNDSADTHCFVCNDYRLFLPFAWSPGRRSFELARYKTKRFCKVHRAAVKESVVIAACVIGATVALYGAALLIMGAESWIK